MVVGLYKMSQNAKEDFKFIDAKAVIGHKKCLVSTLLALQEKIDL